MVYKDYNANSELIEDLYTHNVITYPCTLSTGEQAINFMILWF